MAKNDTALVSLSDRCVLVKVSKYNPEIKEPIYLLINSETLDHIYLRGSTLRTLQKLDLSSLSGLQNKKPKTKKKVKAK